MVSFGRRLKIIPQNDLDSMFLSSVPSTESTMPLASLTIPDRSKVARFLLPDVPQSSVVIEGRSQTRAFIADGIALSNFNLSSADTFRLELFDDTDHRVFDSGEQAAATLIPMGIWIAGINFYGESYSSDLNSIAVLWFAPTVYVRFKLTITTYSNLPFIKLGMVYLGKSFAPQRNFAWGSELKWENTLQLSRTLGGSLLPENSAIKFRTLSLNLAKMTQYDRDLFSRKLRDSTGKSIFVSAYPDQTNKVRLTEYSMICYADTSGSWTHDTKTSHSYQLNLQEI